MQVTLFTKSDNQLGNYYGLSYKNGKVRVSEGDWSGKEDHICEPIGCDGLDSKREKSNIK